VHDPGFPAGFSNALYTGDWTLNKVFRHVLTPKGASFDITQDDFVTIPHPADMVMDARSHLYIASLIGGTFTYVGDTVGGVVRVSYAGKSAEPAPVLASLADNELADVLAGPYAERRLQAQRELLRRGRQGGILSARRGHTMTQRLEQITLDARRPDYARVAAMFTLKQLAGGNSHPVLLRAAEDPVLRALALRAMVDDLRELAGVPSSLYVRSLSDPDPRVQLQAIEGLVRLGARDQAVAIVPLTASADPAVAHVAVKALVALDANIVALGAVDAGSPAVRRGALRALQQMHSHATVAGLIERLRAARDTDARRELLVALARLYHDEGPWNGEWWTTRPSFLGPYYAPTRWAESPTIRPLLRDALVAASGAALDTFTNEFVRNRVLPQGARPLVLAIASASDPERAAVIDALVGTSHLEPAAVAILPALDRRGATLHATVAQLLAGETSVGEQLLPLVRRGVLDSTLDAELRGRLLTSAGQTTDSSARAAATDLFVRTVPGPGTPAAVEAAWRRYVGDRRRGQELAQWIHLAQSGEPAERTLAFSVLVQSVRSPRAPAAVRDRVRPVIAAGWSDPAAAPSLAQAVHVVKAESQYTEQLAAYERARTSKTGGGGDGGANARPDPRDWTQLFNGRDLSGWDIKFKGHPLNENYNDTFRVEDGLLKVRYDKWASFNGEFGHIFTKRPFSYYLVAAEYRFVGEQVPGAGPRNAWAIRNNGIMVHSQSAESMGFDQDFPISLEVQLLGGLGKGPRPTGNLCTPGTNVYFGDTLITRHCTNSTSPTFDGDQWVRVEALVLGDSIIKHIVNGDTVMVYRKPEMGGGSANNTKPGILVNGKPLTEGYIALQAETAPIDFRKVELLDLEGCMDPKAHNYKRYYIKSDPTACR
jgi:HEAT repeat protein